MSLNTLLSEVWYNGWHSFMWVWVCASQRIHTKDIHARLSTRPEEDERRQDCRTEETSQQNRAVSRRERELEPVDSEAGLANVRGWVNVPGGFVGISLEYTLALAHRCTDSYAKVSQTSPFSLLDLGAYPSPCLCVLFSSTISVVYVVFCVSVKKCEIPLAGDEKNH